MGHWTAKSSRSKLVHYALYDTIILHPVPGKISLGQSTKQVTGWKNCFNGLKVTAPILPPGCVYYTDCWMQNSNKQRPRFLLNAVDNWQRRLYTLAWAQYTLAWAQYWSEYSGHLSVTKSDCHRSSGRWKKWDLICLIDVGGYCAILSVDAFKIKLGQGQDNGGVSRFGISLFSVLFCFPSYIQCVCKKHKSSGTPKKTELC